MKKYSIGLDIGTTSVGWAVVDVETNKIIRKGHDKNKKHLWGVRLFDEAEKAEERRGFRSTRRRYDRRRRRLNLLKKEFNDEINKVDPLFFTKLDQFFYKDIDETNKTVHISNKEKKEIFNKYPTIYHLRERLLNDNSKEDIRLIYMAIHHMIKYRGNFNYTSDNFKVTNLNLKDKLIDVFDEIENINTSIELEDSISSIDFDKLDYLLSNPSKDSKESLRELLKGIMPKYFIDEFAKMISGYKFVIKKNV